MKRLLALAGLVAGVIGPFAPPASAHPHDHMCAGIVDENCYMGDPSGKKCHVYYNRDGILICVGHKHCAGTGTVTLSSGLYYVLLGPSVSADIVSLSFTGTCSLTATGSISGNCGNSSGSVTLNDGGEDYSGSYTSAGSVLAFTGEIVGVVDAVPAPGESCLPGGSGADTFLIAGAVVLADS